MRSRSPLLRLGAVTSAAAVVVIGVAGSASAHVTVTPSTTAAGSYSILTFAVPHGCDGSATTSITISMPKEIIEATPTRSALYDVTKKNVKLDKPITAEDGDKITEKVDTITFTAKTPLPDGYRDAFEVQIQVPDEADKVLTFPTIQKCEKGQTGWTEVPAAGQDPESLEHPAPAFTITAPGTAEPEASESPSSSPSATSAPDSTAGSAEAADSDDSSNTWGYLGVAFGVIGIVVGGVALARSRRSA
jgi:uncharacterized protein YcnI